MRRLKNWRFLILLLVALIGLAGNTLSVLTGTRPFTHTNAVFDVKHFIGDFEWIENAPLVLSNHFKKVHLTNVRNNLAIDKNNPSQQVVGFGVQKEIVQIFNHETADFSQDPIDYRNTFSDPLTKKHKVLTRANLLPYLHRLPWGQDYMSVHCAPAVEKNCTLALYWDASKTKRSQSVTFVAVRIHRNFFALIEKNLLEKMTNGAPHA